MANPAPGADRVVATAALVLNELINQLKSEFSDITCIYSEKEEYQEAVELHRSRNKKLNIEKPFFPAFVFNRSVLRHVEHGIGKRLNNLSIPMRIGNTSTANTYKAIHGVMDVNFKFYAENMADMEKFEVLYLSEEGISSRKQLSVDLSGEFGANTVFMYYCVFDKLEEHVFEHAGNYYKSFSGKIYITGVYPVFRSTDPLIESINMRIREFQSGILMYSRTIV